MKAMLLAAGRGERMRPLTDNTPKPLLKVQGRSLIEYHLDKLRLAGISEVVINTSWQAEALTAQLGDGSRYGLSLRYSHEPKALETAGGVAQALPLLGSEPFLLISADIWCDINFDTLTSKHLTSTTLAFLTLVNNPQHNSNGDFSLNGQLVSRNKQQNSLTYSGIGIFHPDLFTESKGTKTPLRDVLYPAIERNTVHGAIYAGDWMDIGTPQRLTELNNKLQK